MKTFLLSLLIAAILTGLIAALTFVFSCLFKVKRNNGELTPKGYNSYLIRKKPIKNGYQEINLLSKKSFFDKYWFLLTFAALFGITLYKIHIGDFQF